MLGCSLVVWGRLGRGYFSRFFKDVKSGIGLGIGREERAGLTGVAI